MAVRRGRIIAAALALLVAVGGLVGAMSLAGDDDQKAAPNESTAERLIADLSKQIEPCVNELTTAVSAIVDSRGAAFADVARQFGIRSLRYEQIRDIYPKVSHEQLLYGTDAAGSLLLSRATEACMLERGDTGAISVEDLDPVTDPPLHDDSDVSGPGEDYLNTGTVDDGADPDTTADTTSGSVDTAPTTEETTTTTRVRSQEEYDACLAHWQENGNYVFTPEERCEGLKP